MDSQYYKDYFYFERNHWWFKARSYILSRYIFRNITKVFQDYKILNVGVATGATTEMLQAFGTVTSIEYEKDCIDFISDKVNIQVIHGSILNLPFEMNSFDLVCCFDVVEHVKDDSKAVSELTRVCKPDGHVLLTVPAFMSLWSEHDLVNHHYRRYRKNEIIKLFQGAGGNAEFATYFNSLFFIPIYVLRFISRLMKTESEELKSDFTKFKPGILNQMLFKVMSWESIFIEKKISFPVGVSILFHWRKPVLK